jgi:hypothetical protein
MAYVVLPPGHGKSHLHQKIEGLYEADTLVNCKATQELADLRKTAKETNGWHDYDHAWVKEIKKVLPDDLRIIMVPADTVGRLVTGYRLFSGVLKEEAWTKNLKNRKGSVEEYHEYWVQIYAEGADLYGCNEDLEHALRDTIAKFYDQTK